MSQFFRLGALLLGSLVGVFWLSQAVSSAANTEKRPPNILLILVDDLGREWLSCYGSTSIETPVLDKLAAGGMKFENFYVMPQCTPTRVALLTGQYPFRNGWVNHWDVPRWGSGCHFDPAHYVTFARLLRQSGYKTAIAGKWQINDFRVQPQVMDDHGFDQWCMWTGYETGNRPSGNRYWDPYIHTREGSKTYAGKFGADVFTDFLIEFMRTHRDKPMMLYFPMALTHGPFTTTPADPMVKGKEAQHKAMVHYVEHCLRRLLDELDRLELRDDTIVIFTTDNGSGGVTGRIGDTPVPGAKAKTNEAGTRMPLIVNCPGRVPAGTVMEELSDITDMLPTFVELAGGKLPGDTEIDGHSIAPLMLGRATEGQRDWILSMGHGPGEFADGRVRGRHDYFSRVIRDKQYKVWIDGGSGPQIVRLYDLGSDPWEEHNLIASSLPEHVAALSKFQEIVKALPDRDAAPRYDMLPPQKWDLHRESKN